MTAKPMEIKKFLNAVVIIIMAFAGAGIAIGLLVRMVRWIGGI